MKTENKALMLMVDIRFLKWDYNTMVVLINLLEKLCYLFIGAFSIPLGTLTETGCKLNKIKQIFMLISEEKP